MDHAHPAAEAERAHHGATATISLAGTTAVAVADVLDLAAELPTTPAPVAAEAAATARELSGQIASAGRHPTHVEVASCCVVLAAGMLALIGGMPSTPPAVAADAEAWSSELWDTLTDDEPHDPGGERRHAPG
jgi:hypothetical protein